MSNFILYICSFCILHMCFELNQGFFNTIFTCFHHSVLNGIPHILRDQVYHLKPNFIGIDLPVFLKILWKLNKFHIFHIIDLGNRYLPHCLPASFLLFYVFFFFNIQWHAFILLCNRWFNIYCVKITTRSQWKNYTATKDN